LDQRKILEIRKVCEEGEINAKGRLKGRNQIYFNSTIVLFKQGKRLKDIGEKIISILL